MARDTRQSDGVLDELIAIKKLLVLKLLNEGFTQKQIGLALGVDQSQISRMVPARAFKETNKNK